MINTIIILTIIFLFYLFRLYKISINKEKKIEDELESNINNRINTFRLEYEKTQKQLYDLKFKEWKNENEFEIRRKAINTSRFEIEDLISEEISLINNNFSFNPKDIKFVGRFIDLIIFDGISDESEVKIYFVEILNKSHLDLNKYKRKVEKAILNGNYHFKEINL